jgi:high affinity sulfate transporter 1
VTTASGTDPGTPTEVSFAARWIPIVRWLPRYDRSWLALDVVAGLTLWGLVVPEGMAYAGIAGLPPQAGLYTLVASLLVYALFGTSRHLSVSATSATAALIASTVVAVGVSAGDVKAYVSTAAALVLVVGGVFLLAGVARLGFVSQFLSRPVMDGFVTGLAIFVAVGQLNKLFGVSKGDGNTFEKLGHVIRQLPNTNAWALAMGAGALVVLTVLPRIARKLPAGLVVLFGAIALSSALDLAGGHGVAVVGSLPQGLPTPGLPHIPFSTWVALVPAAIGILLVAYSEALGVAREFAAQHGYEIDPDQELVAHGASNLVGGLLGGLIGAGGMSASAVKEGAGARSQVANLVAWVATIVTLFVLTPLFKSLPEAVLAALIIHAVWHLIVARKLRRIRVLSKEEWSYGLVTLAGVLLFDVLVGMLIGLVVSLLIVIYRASRPKILLLGSLPSTPGVYVALDRNDDATPVQGVVVLRVDQPLWYANALSVHDAVLAAVANRPATRAVVLDAGEVAMLDVTSSDVLLQLAGQLHERSIGLWIGSMQKPARDFAVRSGLAAALGDEHIQPSLELAVRAAEQAVPESSA